MGTKHRVAQHWLDREVLDAPLRATPVEPWGYEWVTTGSAYWNPSIGTISSGDPQGFCRRFCVSPQPLVAPSIHTLIMVPHFLDRRYSTHRSPASSVGNSRRVLARPDRRTDT